MRHRPDLQLFVEPAVFSGGATFTALLKMESHSLTHSSGVQLELVGEERRYRYSSGGKVNTAYYHERTIVRLGAKIPAFDLTPGTHERRVSFVLPPDAPPSFGSRLTTISYKLAVHVIIPWWLDARSSYDIVVAPQPVVMAAAQQVTRFVTSDQVKKKELFIEASLDTLEFAPGEVIEGALSLANVAGFRVQSIRAALVRIERALVETSIPADEGEVVAWNIHEGKPKEAEPLRFALKISKAVPPDMVTPFIVVTHQLVFTAKISFGTDVHLRIPVRVHRRQGEKGESHLAPAAVGKLKLTSNWHQVIRSFNLAGLSILSIEEESDEVKLSFEGRTIQITSENRGADGPHLTAEFDFPRLGLELQLSERKWHDIGGVNPGKVLRDRFLIEARDGEQAKPFFTEKMIEGMSRFDEVTLKDGHCAVAAPGSAHEPEALRHFVAAVMTLSSRLGRASQSLPAPAGMGDALPAYRAFADRRSALLTPGDLSITGLEASGVPISIQHRFDKAEPMETILSAELGSGTRLPEDFVATASKKLGKTVELSDKVVRLRFPLVTDPTQMESMIDSVGELIHSLETGARVGPYR